MLKLLRSEKWYTSNVNINAVHLKALTSDQKGLATKG